MKHAKFNFMPLTTCGNPEIYSTPK